MADGWRLSPAFDVNPNAEKATYVINIDDVDNRPILDSAMPTADFYELSDTRAAEVCEEVLLAVSTWKSVANKLRIANVEISLMETVFLS